MASYSEELQFLPITSITLGGTAQRIVSEPFLKREFIIEAHINNTSDIIMSDTKANAEAGNGHRLAPGQSINLAGVVVESRQVDYDLFNTWVVSATTSDNLIVSYKERINAPDA